MVSAVMDLNFFYQSAGSAHIKKERQKAKDLRKSRWWQQELQQGICYYCEGKFPVAELTMDHKVPLARGGMSTKSNIVVCCKSCNTEKQSKTAAEMVLG